MKKLNVSGMVLIIVTVLAASVFTTCIDPEGDIVNPFYDFGLRHAHEWGEWTLFRDATCVEDGELIRACVDDETHIETKPIPKDPIAHNWEVREDKNYVHPTCTEPGYAFQRCTLCEKIDTHREIPPLGHEFETYELTALPNCSAPGTETAHCVRQISGCDKTDEHFLPVDPDAHEWNDEYEVTVFSTCSAKGEETDACAFNAEHIRTRETDEDPDAHDWYEIYFETAVPTCMAEGEETRYCGYNIAHTESRETAIDPDAHVYDTYLLLAAATCTAEGEERGTCVYNRSHVPDRRVIPIDPEAHEYGEWHLVGMVGVAATCTEAGEELRACAINAMHIDKREIYVNPDAHNWNNNYRMTTAPTCSAPGVSTDTCRNSEAHTRTQSIEIDINAHNFGNYSLTTAPTCEAYGEDTRKCTYNNAHTGTRYIAPLGHNWNNNYQITTPATCTNFGYSTDRCARDNSHIRQMAIARDPNAHNWGGYVVQAAASCMGTGYNLRTCSLNGDHTEGLITPINPNAHNWGAYAQTTAPTCTAAGVDTRRCSYNSIQHYETRTGAAALGHAWGSPAVTASTCMTAGSERRICGRDNSHIDTQPLAIDPNAHNWGAWQTDQVANCSYEGVERRFCSYNPSNNPYLHGETRRSPIDPNVHDYRGEYQTATVATCIAAGEEVTYCYYRYFHPADNKGDLKRPIPIDSNAHDYSGTWVYTGVTVEQNGTRTKTCKHSSAHKKSETAYAIGTPGIQYESPYNGAFKVQQIRQSDIPAGVTKLVIPSYKLVSDIYPSNSGDDRYLPVVEMNKLTNGNWITEVIMLYDDGGGLRILPEDAFTGCTALKRVEMNGVTKIERRAFQGCTNLTTVECRAVENILQLAFDGCSKLTALIGTASSNALGYLRYIGDAAFRNCTSYAEFRITRGVETVGTWAFDGWTSSQRIIVYGQATEAAADDAWMVGPYWRYGCDATIIYNP